MIKKEKDIAAELDYIMKKMSDMRDLLCTLENIIMYRLNKVTVVVARGSNTNNLFYHQKRKCFTVGKNV